MFESKSGIFFIAGLGFFGLSFVVMAVLPWTIYAGEEEKTIEQLASRGIVPEFVELAERFPEQFKQYFGEVSYESFAEALELGHDTYVAEACWHCHSQFVRPVSNEDLRWGPVSHALEYQNEMQRPVLFGTRRVGPDLSREAGIRSNDWHLAHFWKPSDVVPTSVMPSYRWFFDANGYPNKRGMAVVTYVQWLGSWLKEYPYFHGDGPSGPDTPPSNEAIAQGAS
jgi:cytochrome c oxidase cbb3-type subunit 2